MAFLKFFINIFEGIINMLLLNQILQQTKELNRGFAKQKY